MNGQPPAGFGGQQLQGGPNGMNQAAMQALLAGGMTQEKFATLTPAQQAQLREMLMAKSRAAAQAGLGNGFPSGPPSQGTPAPGGQAGSPAPIPPSQSGAPGSAPSSAAFMRTLADFWNKRGTPFTGAPVVEGRPLDLGNLYMSVARLGGFAKVQGQGQWRAVLSQIGFPPDPSQLQGHPDSRVQAVAQVYHQVLLQFEIAVQNAQQSKHQMLQQQQQQQALMNQQQQNQQAQQQQQSSRPPTMSGTSAPQQPPAQPNGMPLPVGYAGQAGAVNGRPANIPLSQTSLPTQVQGVPLPFPSATLVPGSMGPPPTVSSTPQAEDRKGKGKGKTGELDRRASKSDNPVAIQGVRCG